MSIDADSLLLGLATGFFATCLISDWIDETDRKVQSVADDFFAMAFAVGAGVSLVADAPLAALGCFLLSMLCFQSGEADTRIASIYDRCYCC